MKFLKQYCSTVFALLPLVAIVLFVHLFLFQFETTVIAGFLASMGLVSVGETLLLMGIDSTIMPMGEYMVSSVNKASKFIFFIFFAIIFGMFATIAEPDVSIFTNQVVSAGVGISKSVLQLCIGGGVGLFIAFAIFKIIKKVNVRVIYLLLFLLIFALGGVVDKDLIALAFDAGGATTGIITAPFLLAIASGVSKKVSPSKDSEEVFGMVGIVSLGPIIVMLLIFLLLGKGTGSFSSDLGIVNIFLSVLKQSYLSILPLTFIFFVYDLFFIKLPIKKKMEFLIGLLITFVGMYLFLFGIDFGISDLAYKLGEFLYTIELKYLLIFSVVLGFIITFTEPAVIVLSKRVEVETNRNIPFVAVMIAVAVSMAVAIVLAVLKILFDINFFVIILIGYSIALILSFFVPSIFTNLAFDSGGVASGPMTTAVLLPIMLALASSSSNSIAGFGIIGIVAMTPIVVVQFLGFIYNVGVKKKLIIDRKHALSLSYTKDMYSNVERLEQMLKKKKRRSKNEE